MRKLLSLFTALLFVGSVWGATYSLVTDATTLSDGDEIIVVNTAANQAIGPQATNNRTGVAVTASNNLITPGVSVQIITLEASSTNWKLKVGTDLYLYAASSSSNYLKSASSKTAGDNGVWSIAITNTGVATLTAQGSNSRKLMRYNPNNNNPVFSCYATSSSTGTLVAIYKKYVITT